MEKQGEYQLQIGLILTAYCGFWCISLSISIQMSNLSIPSSDLLFSSAASAKKKSLDSSTVDGTTVVKKKRRRRTSGLKNKKDSKEVEKVTWSQIL